MKQKIRYRTFETNSSSYHTITIYKESEDKEVLQELEIGKPVTLTGKIKVSYIGSTESYAYVSKTKLDKANMLLRYISTELDEWLRSQEDNDSEYAKKLEGKDYLHQTIIKREKLLECPLLTALKKVIEEYIQNEVTFKFSDLEYFELVWDEAKSLDEILNIDRQLIFDEKTLISKYKEIIFNEDIKIKEECESNE